MHLAITYSIWFDSYAKRIQVITSLISEFFCFFVLGLPIRGYMIENDQIMTQANPVDLTKSEDWVWLRLEDLTDFEKCRQKGINRSTDLNLEMTIKTAKADDFDEIQKMIEELAIYENMLDQCQMTAEKLKEDYSKSPTLYAPKEWEFIFHFVYL